MLITLSRRAAICQSVAEVQLTGVALLGAISHRLLTILFISRSLDLRKITCISSLRSCDKRLLMPFSIFSYLLQLPISSFVSQIIKEFCYSSYSSHHSFHFRHLSFNSIMKKTIYSQKMTNPIGNPTQDIVQKDIIYISAMSFFIRARFYSVYNVVIHCIWFNYPIEFYLNSESNYIICKLELQPQLILEVTWIFSGSLNLLPAAIGQPTSTRPRTPPEHIEMCFRIQLTHARKRGLSK